MVQVHFPLPTSLTCKKWFPWPSVLLPGDLAIGDITLGLFAMMTGNRTLSQYIEDMTTRPLDLAEGETFKPQSQKRIGQVQKALEPLQDLTFRRVAGGPLDRLGLLMEG